MKFKSDIDEKIVREEAERLGVGIEEYFIKRRELEIGLADIERSNISKKNWREKRWKYLKGIRKFHRSTKGKEFHRNLGRFLSTREFEGDLKNYQTARDSDRKEECVDFRSVDENKELLIGLTSLVTHALIELRYYSGGINEGVEYLLLLNDILVKFKEDYEKIIMGRVEEVDFEFWKSLLEEMNDTEYLMSIEGMKEKIQEGLRAGIEDCVEDVWRGEDGEDS